MQWIVTESSTPEHFEVERSYDGIQFTEIGSVQPSDGKPHTTGIVYNFTDNVYNQGELFYRLKMIDVSGTVTYSRQLQVKVDATRHGILVYPTITKGTVSIFSSEKIESAEVRITDMSGRKITSKHIGAIEAGQTLPVSFQMSSAHGITILQVFDKGILIASRKILLQ